MLRKLLFAYFSQPEDIAQVFSTRCVVPPPFIQRFNEFHMVFPFTVQLAAWCRKGPNLEEIWKWSNALNPNTHKHTPLGVPPLIYFSALSPYLSSCQLGFSDLPPFAHFSHCPFISCFCPATQFFPDRIAEASWLSCHHPISHVWRGHTLV